MDKKLERLYEQLGRIDSVIEKQTSQRLEKMKEIQQKRDADKRAWMKEAGPVIDTFLLRHHPARPDESRKDGQAQDLRPERRKGRREDGRNL